MTQGLKCRRCKYKAEFKTFGRWLRRFKAGCPKCKLKRLERDTSVDVRHHMLHFFRRRPWDYVFSIPIADYVRKYAPDHYEHWVHMERPEPEREPDPLDELLERLRSMRPRVSKPDYYKHAVATHPDLGGSAEEFKSLAK